MSDKLFDEKGNLVFKVNYFDFIDNIPEKETLELIESLSCNDKVIEHVINQIFDGWTENGCSGGERSGNTYPTTALEKARERVSKEANWLCRKEVKRLQRVCESKDKLSDAGWDAYHKLRGERMSGYL